MTQSLLDLFAENGLTEAEVNAKREAANQGTREHIALIQKIMKVITDELTRRATIHDQSKLEEPEASVFAIYTDKLHGLTYGSDEYKKCLEGMKIALDHHYANNSHHPQYYPNGVLGMDIFDIIEMVVDWLASSRRHADGDIYKSLEINKERFKLPDHLYQTIKMLIDGILAKEKTDAN